MEEFVNEQESSPDGGGNHELKFGFGYRKTPVTSVTEYGGDMWGQLFAPGGGLVNVFRDGVKKFESAYVSGYVGDTFTKDRLTVNLGVRYDHQTANNEATVVPANPFFPSALPGIDYDGSGVGVSWNDISPRAGLTYALDDARKTVVRASYARYAGQLPTGFGTQDNPLLASYLQYYWDDLNGDSLPQPNEVLTGAGVYYAYSLQRVQLGHRADPDSRCWFRRLQPAGRDPEPADRSPRSPVHLLVRFDTLKPGSPGGSPRGSCSRLPT